MSTTSEIIDRCQALFDDLNFSYAREWKAAVPGRIVVGFMPFYVPRELIHAAGGLPLGVLGGGDQLEVIHGDAYYQSYICRIPRSTIELGVTDRLDFVDAHALPVDLRRDPQPVGHVEDHVPEGQEPLFRRAAELPRRHRRRVLRQRARRAARRCSPSRAAREVTDDAIRASIALYNENRALVREVYAFRARQPWKAPSVEVYLLMRAGMILAVEEHNRMLREYLAAAPSRIARAATIRASSSPACSASNRR